MDFFKSLIGSIPEKDSDDDFNPKPCLDAHWGTMEKGIDLGRDIYHKIQKQMVAETKEIHEAGKDGAFIACVALFTCAHMIVGWLWGGVKATFKLDGKSSQVWRIWKVLEAAFACGPNAPMSEVKERVAKVSREIGDE